MTREQLAIEALRDCESAFVVLFGDANGAVPETVSTRLGVPLRLRQIISDAQAALAVPVEPVPLPGPAPADGPTDYERFAVAHPELLSFEEQIMRVTEAVCEAMIVLQQGGHSVESIVKRLAQEGVILVCREDGTLVSNEDRPAPPVVEGKP